MTNRARELIEGVIIGVFILSAIQNSAPRLAPLIWNVAASVWVVFYLPDGLRAVWRNWKRRRANRAVGQTDRKTP